MWWFFLNSFLRYLEDCRCLFYQKTDHRISYVEDVHQKERGIHIARHWDLYDGTIQTNLLK